MNNSAKLILLAVSGLLLASCAQRQYQPTAGEIQRNNSVQIENSAQSRLRQCTETAEAIPEVGANAKLVDSQVLNLKVDSPNRLELMTSEARITEVQKKALLAYLAATQSCRTGIKNDLSQIPPLFTLIDVYQGEMEILYARLISRKVTIGEANQQRAQLFSKLRTDYSAATQNLNSQFNSQISQELQARQQEDSQRRALAAQYLMNQQAIQSQQNIANQQRLQNQMNQNRPVTTNCNRFGNQVNCTSY